MIYLFIVFYLFALYVESFPNYRKGQFLLIACLVLALGAGTRNQLLWPDTDAYLISFLEYTPSFSEYKTGDVPYGYSEIGFYFIGVIVKSFTNSSVAYLTIVSILTFLFLEVN